LAARLPADAVAADFILSDPELRIESLRGAYPGQEFAARARKKTEGAGMTNFSSIVWPTVEDDRND
jgi:hypothetical protein